VRQYNQFMAIFDNFDVYLENLENAKNSAGSLQEQSDIYAEGWEAARDRVKAAAESIYSSLINEDFFIALNNFLEKGLDGINGLIKALGGIPGVLGAIGTVVTSVFSE